MSQGLGGPHGELSGRVVLVTGGARGLGVGIARVAAANGAAVAVTARDGDRAAAVAAEIAERGGVAIGLRCDVVEPASVDGAVEAVVDRFGFLDVVVHSATSHLSNVAAAVEDVAADAWESHVAVGLRALYHLARAGASHLARRRGSLCVLTSPAGLQGSANLPAYAAVKGAQRGFVKSLALEWGPVGVRVNGVAPLAMSDALAERFTQFPERRAQLESLVALRRIGDADADIAPAVVFLSSDAARYVTGQILYVNGGRFTLAG